jgi:CheY-like chemotaxis protein
MTARVLFVDDEEPLLTGIERRFGGEFELRTALSGAAALDAMASDGPFAVVMTDMRMPQMDGLEFIRQARRQWPDATYMMLTGNQDLQTAVNAVNDGQVFRFLNKPCPAEDLRRALHDGLRQYQLVHGEKELLSKTFAGAVGVLTDVLSILRPGQFTSGQDVENIFEHLQTVLGSMERWEYKLAARLSLIGFAVLDHAPDQTGGIWLMDDGRFAKAAAIGQRLLERIPRLETVAQIIGEQPRAHGDLPPQTMLDAAGVVKTGATLLRASVLWDHLCGTNLSTSAALAELQQHMPKLPPDIVAELSRISPPPLHLENETCTLDNLIEGMVLASNVVGRDGAILISAGRRLTPTLIEKILEYAKSVGVRPVEIIAPPKPPVPSGEAPNIIEELAPA